MKIGCITLDNDPSQKAVIKRNAGEIEKFIAAIFMDPSEFVHATARNQDELRAALIRLSDAEKCPLILTLGGTGPGLSDIAPETTREVLDRELPGFGEIMRYYSYERVKNAALSRATAGIRAKSLIINFPGRAKGVKFCLRLLQEAISEGIEYLTGTRPVLRGDEIVIPIEKYLPFLKRFRIKADPRGEHPPLLPG
jgi:molybdopterin adenylyltransferase